MSGPSISRRLSLSFAVICLITSFAAKPALAAPQSVCLKESTGKISTKRRCKARRGEVQLSAFNFLSSVDLSLLEKFGKDGEPGDPGKAGVNCWDTNGNGFDDQNEDTNGDGVFNALDCQSFLSAGAGILIDNDEVSLDTDFAEGLFWSRNGNTDTDSATEFIGTLDDEPFEIRVNNARAFRIEATEDTFNIFGGGSDNEITDGVKGATISGGGAPFTGQFLSIENHQIFDDYGTIGGGHTNVVGTDDQDPTNQNSATVAGGRRNIAAGDASAVCGGTDNVASGTQASFVGGGFSNDATGSLAVVAGGFANEATNTASAVLGGQINKATGFQSAILSGQSNKASNQFAVVLGGQNSEAGGAFSMASGRQAKADDNGSYVFSDNTFSDVTSFGSNTFSVRASGGTRFYSSGNLSTGVELAAGSGAWANLSDRNKKENFRAVDPQEVLEKVASMPIETWNYIAQDDSVRHMGPVAQDFHEAFSLGSDETRISTVDADGVALAAIQALHEQLEIERSKNEILAEQLLSLAERVSKLEAQQ